MNLRAPVATSGLEIGGTSPVPTEGLANASSAHDDRIDLSSDATTLDRGRACVDAPRRRRPTRPHDECPESRFRGRGAAPSNESREQYEGTLTAWLETLRPANGAEGRLVARIADIDFRLQRLSRVEKKQILASVDAAVAGGFTAKEKARLTHLKAAVGGMACAAEQVSLAARPEGLKEILPSIRAVVEELIGVHLPGPGTGALYRTRRSLAEDNLEREALDAVWKSLGAAARQVEVELSAKLDGLAKELDTERDELLEQKALGDDKEAKKLDRYRSALQRELDQVLATLKSTRELAAQSINPGQAAFLGPLRVDLRILPARRRCGDEQDAPLTLQAVR